MAYASQTWKKLSAEHRRPYRPGVSGLRLGVQVNEQRSAAGCEHFCAFESFVYVEAKLSMFEISAGSSVHSIIYKQRRLGGKRGKIGKVILFTCQFPLPRRI